MSSALETIAETALANPQTIANAVGDVTGIVEAPSWAGRFAALESLLGEVASFLTQHNPTAVTPGIAAAAQTHNSGS